CFAEVYPGEHCDRLLGELVHDPALATPAVGLSRRVAERRGLQAPELIGSHVVALDAEALERLATGTWVKHSKGFPRSLRAVLDAVRALGKGARFTYWFETD